MGCLDLKYQEKASTASFMHYIIVYILLYFAIESRAIRTNSLLDENNVLVEQHVVSINKHVLNTQVTHSS